MLQAASTYIQLLYSLYMLKTYVKTVTHANDDCSKLCMWRRYCVKGTVTHACDTGIV